MADVSEGFGFGLTIPRMLELSAKEHAGREAIVLRDVRLTYEELLGRVYAFGNALVELGVQPGDKVGVWLPNYPEWVVANIGIAAAGAITVPINTRFRSDEARFILKAAEVSTLVTTDAFMTNHYLDMLAQIAPEYESTGGTDVRSAALPELRNVISVRAERRGTLSFEDLLKGQDTTASAELRRRIDSAAPDDPVNMFWTSGTTAQPKGALAPHTVLGNVGNLTEMLEYSSADRCLVPTPLFYTTANYWAMHAALLHGACMVLLLEFTPEEALAAIDQEAVSVTIGIPNMFIGYLQHPDFERSSMESLRAAWMGGATTPVELIREMRSRMGLELFCQVYGMTETGGITTITPPDAPDELMAESVGRPLPNFELRLVDPETGEDVGPGMDGELWVRSPYNLKSYYGMPENELDQYFPGEGWYRTGDILRRDEQDNYSFRGRTKDMIKVGGENVAAREVETVLFSHPAVRQVAVLGIPDAQRNEAIIAFVECREEIDGDVLRQYCREHLAPFKVPKEILFTSDWPLTPTGKIQKFRLLDQLEGAAHGGS